MFLTHGRDCKKKKITNFLLKVNTNHNNDEGEREKKKEEQRRHVLRSRLWTGLGSQRHPHPWGPESTRTGHVQDPSYPKASSGAGELKHQDFTTSVSEKNQEWRCRQLLLGIYAMVPNAPFFMDEMSFGTSPNDPHHKEKNKQTKNVNAQSNLRLLTEFYEAYPLKRWRQILGSHPSI